MIVGHKKVIGMWKVDKPATCLLLGPASVGKRTFALDAMEKLYGVSMTVQEVPSTPFAGNIGYVVPGDDLEGVQRLLALRKDHPVIIYSDEWTPLAKEVDAVYRFGLLSYDEVVEILSKKRLVPPDAVTRSAKQSNGQIARAISYHRTDANRQIVKNILKATRTGDLDFLAQSMQGLRSFYPVVVWWTEAVTGVWHVYSEAESFECHTSESLLEDVRHAAQVYEAGCPIQVATRLAFWPTCERQAR